MTPTNVRGQSDLMATALIVIAVGAVVAFLGFFVAALATHSFSELIVSIILIAVFGFAGPAAVWMNDKQADSVQYLSSIDVPSETDVPTLAGRQNIPTAALTRSVLRQKRAYVVVVMALFLVGLAWLCVSLDSAITGLMIPAEIGSTGPVIGTGLVCLSVAALALFGPIFVAPKLSAVIVGGRASVQVWSTITTHELREFARHWPFATTGTPLRRRGFVALTPTDLELWQKCGQELVRYSFVSRSLIEGVESGFAQYAWQPQPAAILKISRGGHGAAITLPLLVTSDRGLRYAPEGFIAAIKA
jgi:hypothetical protein